MQSGLDGGQGTRLYCDGALFAASWGSSMLWAGTHRDRHSARAGSPPSGAGACRVRTLARGLVLTLLAVVTGTAQAEDSRSDPADAIAVTLSPLSGADRDCVVVSPPAPSSPAQRSESALCTGGLHESNGRVETRGPSSCASVAAALRTGAARDGFLFDPVAVFPALRDIRYHGAGRAPPVPRNN